jgi:hypothetical protein
MGGGISWSAMEDSSVYVRALVLVGSGFSSGASYTPNTLLATGYFDSLSSYPQNLTRLDSYFNVTGVEAEVTYGDFASNTARRAIFPATNHLFETVDPVIVSESLEWMKNSLKGGVEDEYWIASTSLLYPLWLAGGLFGLLGALLTIFPLIAILLDTPIFSELKGAPKDEPTTTRSFISNGIIYGLIGTITFFPFLFIGTLLSYTIPFPQYYGIPVMSWMIGSALFAALFLFIILKRRTDRQRALQDGTIGVENAQTLTVKGLLGTGSGKPVLAIIRTLVMTLILFAWLYVLTLVVDLGLALDLRSFLPGLHDLTLTQATFVPLYFVVFLIYTLIDGAWLTGIMLPSAEGTWTRIQFIWTVKAVLIKTFPYLILIAFEFVGGYLAGAPLVPGIIGYSFLFFYAFTPWFAICTVITMFAYRMTGNRWLGAMVNAILCAWLLASILAFRG